VPRRRIPALLQRAFPPRNRVCVFATVAYARPGIGEEILQFNKMWLEFRQQEAMDLSSGRGNLQHRSANPALPAKT
jgi:hypothetical protein